MTSDILAKILDLADDAIISVDQQQRIVVFNRGAERIFGYSAAEVRGRTLDLLLPERFSAAHHRHITQFGEGAVTARRMGERREILGRRKNGDEFPAEASISKVDVGSQRMYSVILRDVTTRTLAEDKIRNALREKEALLREIHHRVKNNLQVVSSLLGLQSRGVRDPQTRRLFSESQNRVHSMALLHETLYESDDLSQVDFQEYVAQLAQHLFRSYGVGGDRIRLVTDLGSLRLNMDLAVPFGLIINELVSNSLKYAFPDERAGEIRIAFQVDAHAQGQLIVSDNGVGLPAGLDPATVRSLGLRLVRTLSEQVGASFEIRSDGGTRVRLTFPHSASRGSASQ
ncbi:MAG TPA: histidine kinase dimerization/phosphoacceptor domain -containing protein [Bryobacteraceae bacterium]|nr:histidine kinase dimerization/phosphoacceptor domain -containing protein [Bryobacteraceae bacterium]